MIILNDETKASLTEKYRAYKDMYRSESGSRKLYYLPPYGYRAKNLKGVFDEGKYLGRQSDCYEYLTNRASKEVATKTDINILAALVELGCASKDALFNFFAAESKIYPDKYLMGDRTERGIENRLKSLEKLFLVRKLKCTVKADGNDFEFVEGAPDAYVCTYGGYELLLAKKRGVIRYEKKIETSSPFRFSERLCSNQVVVALSELNNYAGLGNRRIMFTRLENRVEYCLDEYALDGCVQLKINDDKNISVAVISITLSCDTAFETKEDMVKTCEIKLACAKEFLHKVRFNGRVIFVCENLEAVEMLKGAFSRTKTSEGGYSEFCYIMTSPMVEYCKDNGVVPFKAMLQIAYDMEKEEDYIVSAAYKFMEDRDRLVRKKGEANG